MNDMDCRIKLHWDSEAAVWTATSDDIPGLVLESGSCDALIERLKYAVPELAFLNGVKATVYRLSYTFDRQDMVQAAG